MPVVTIIPLVLLLPQPPTTCRLRVKPLAGRTARHRTLELACVSSFGRSRSSPPRRMAIELTRACCLLDSCRARVASTDPWMRRPRARPKPALDASLPEQAPPGHGRAAALGAGLVGAWMRRHPFSFSCLSPPWPPHPPHRRAPLGEGGSWPGGGMMSCLAPVAKKEEQGCGAGKKEHRGGWREEEHERRWVVGGCSAAGC
jgi:hypothetical protein